MIVEVSGAGFHNMGAALMLVAATEALRSWADVQRVVVSLRTGTRTQRKRAGCVSVMRLDAEWRPWAGRLVALGARTLPSVALEAVGIHKPSRIDALLDASGFAFGDQWGPRSALRKAPLFKAYSGTGRPVVLLPQAFGPFEQPLVREATVKALENVDLIFARDAESLAHLQGLRLSKPRIESAPDFTNLVEPRVLDPAKPSVVLIPNARMDEMAAASAGHTYTNFLRDCLIALLGRGFHVVLVVHEPADRAYAERLVAEFGHSADIHSDADPVRAKALVGGAALVVSSRYHGLVNALSQCIPAIGTSWSHKYDQLFADYGCEDSLWDAGDPRPVPQRLEHWLAERSLAARAQALRAPAGALKSEARKMWGQVSAIISA